VSRGLAHLIQGSVALDNAAGRSPTCSNPHLLLISRTANEQKKIKEERRGDPVSGIESNGRSAILRTRFE
jgi:hypothetical protein